MLGPGYRVVIEEIGFLGRSCCLAIANFLDVPGGRLGLLGRLGVPGRLGLLVLPAKRGSQSSCRCNDGDDDEYETWIKGVRHLQRS